MLRQLAKGVCTALVLATLLLPSTADAVPMNDAIPMTDAVPMTDAPPYAGTVYISPEVLTPVDPSDFTGNVTYQGLRFRTVFDRRDDAFVRAPVHQFLARFGCGQREVTILVNQEFSRRQARVEAQRFARVLGQIPPGMRRSVDELWIHAGDLAAGGGNGSILIHTGWFDGTSDDIPMANFIEETFLHEAAHTTLDAAPAGGGRVDRAAWRDAVAQDGSFISTYAQDNAATEDIAESYGAFAAWVAGARTGQLAAEALTIEQTMPSRIKVFRSLGPAFEIGTRQCPVYP